ncbi:helix-turn-helix domain-containing protein [Halorussus marinus]|uniref:helix-turn-helix domain-containing protein n=1 Tax=Halorussus marinus TaxID=2505976 RepID=UPI001092390B|nr:helix-turn-helix domain-containing protein [Halorussus marinus]
MSEEGVHAELAVEDRSVCRIASASESARIQSVSRSGRTGDAVTVEFTAEAAADLDDVTEVFHYGDEVIYRFECPTGATPECACELVESHGCPVRHLDPNEGAIALSFVASNIGALREIVSALRETYDGVTLRRLTRSTSAEGSDDLVFVDRTELTSRQREVLETAHEMGYFDHPKGANATDISETLGINRSTFAEHLSAAQSKILTSVLEA